MPCFIHYQHPEPPESATFPSTTLFRSWGSCLHGYSENIAINTSATVESAIEWAIFSMMYDDQACCRNGHRENFLKCTYDDTWRMGFGFQKGKFNFGGGRIYETWFLSWDFAKIGRTSGCTWEQGKGTKSCPDDPMRSEERRGGKES